MDLTDDSSNKAYVAPDCAICMVPLVRDLIATSDCGHTFHSVCYLNWCRTHAGNVPCPICRTASNYAVSLTFELEAAQGPLQDVINRLQYRLQSTEEKIDAQKAEIDRLISTNNVIGLRMTDLIQEKANIIRELEDVKKNRDELRRTIQRNKTKIDLARYQENPEGDEECETLIADVEEDRSSLKLVLWNLHQQNKESAKLAQLYKTEVADLRGRLERSCVRIRQLKSTDTKFSKGTQFDEQFEEIFLTGGLRKRARVASTETSEHPYRSSAANSVTIIATHPDEFFAPKHPLPEHLQQLLSSGYLDQLWQDPTTPADVKRRPRQVDSSTNTQDEDEFNRPGPSAGTGSTNDSHTQDQQQQQPPQRRRSGLKAWKRIF